MMVYLALVIIAAATLLVLKMSKKLNRTAMELAVIAVLIGVAGYVWQGSPTLPSSPVGQAVPLKSK